MNDDQAALASFAGTARLFPLPNLVLFPRVTQGLHIFEPRYRQMTADALASDRLIAMALLRPGWEDQYDHTPPIEPVACLGRITRSEHLPDGRYNLALRGLSRVRVVEEVASEKLYRLARVEVIADSLPDDLAVLASLRATLSAAVLARFDAASESHKQLTDLFRGDQPLGEVCDLLAYALPLHLQLKQQLLEEPRAEVRAEILTHAVRTKPAGPDRSFPPPFSEN